MTQTRDDFAKSVMRRLDESREAMWGSKADGYYGESLRASAASAPALGHPRFVDLRLGESGSTDAVAMFLDLRKFTARSFWDPPEEVLRVNVAVITELASAVARHGGHVLGFRGDGVFACFDPPHNLGARAAAAFAVGSAAWAIDAVRNALNNLLKLSGIEPVQVRVGMDFGRLDFVRIGSEGGSEVNVLGFAANFASKCEKAAHSWEVVAGESLAELLPPQDVTRHHTASYTRGSDTRYYKLFDVNHARYLADVEGIADQLAGRPLSSVGVR